MTKRTIPLDTLFRQIERKFNSGRIAIKQDGTISETYDVYDERFHHKLERATDIDRAMHRHCPHCNTAYRSTEQHANAMDRCPFCHHII